VSAVVGVDDETTVFAARAAAALGLRHNPVDAVQHTRDKFRARQRFAAAGLQVPRFERHALDDNVESSAARADYPCVLKPLCLSASRGVIRADTPEQFVRAWKTIASILIEQKAAGRDGDVEHLLVEGYIPGEELAIEGLLEQGRLRALAVFDKPDPLEGPTFEETLFVTPSRQPRELQRAAIEETARGCTALGLREGPVHAELRLRRGQPWLLEVAARTIGGLCSRALRFGAGVSLEELILRHQLGRPTADLTLAGRAAGVMMIPVPRAGILRDVEGIDAARALPDIEEITLSVHRGAELVPLPIGHRYIGFIFARADSPQRVEAALREAHSHLLLTIEGS
jgi:biotin carboxylase